MNALQRYIDLDQIRIFALRGSKGTICLIVPFKVLEVSLDESADQRREEIYCVAAFLIAPKLWKALESRWLERLAKDGIEYFRATDCKSVNGAFKKLIAEYGSVTRAKVAAARIRLDLETILLESHWIGIALGVVMQDYKKVLAAVPEARLFYGDDPMVAAYGQIFYEVAQSVSRNAPDHLIAFLTDQSEDYPKQYAALMATKAMYPSLGKRIATVAPFDDKITPSVQIADLLASVTRESFVAWLTSGVQASNQITERWENHIESFGLWDEEHMLETIRESLAGNVGLLPQPQKVSRRQNRRDQRTKK